MASKKEVWVAINGKETVSEAADSAEASLTIFGKKIPIVADATKLLELAIGALRAAFGALKQYAMDSLAAFDAYTGAQMKLRAQSKLTGMSMDELNTLVGTAREQFGLGTVAAVDITAAVAKFSTAAGASSRSSQLMATALELGAAAGMDAKQVAEGLSSALAGNDEWLNRLGLSNPSVIWEKYRVANGLAKDQMDDTTKALAVMTEIMDAGSKVTGTYAERMESGAGLQERLNNKIEEGKVAFGQAIQPLRIFVVQGLTNLVDVSGRVMLAVGRVTNLIGVLLVGAFEAARSVVGAFAYGYGLLTRNTEIAEWGRQQTSAFSDFTKQLDKLEKKYLVTGDAAKESETKQVAAVTNVATAGKTAADKAEKEVDRLNRVLSEKLGKPMEVVIGMTTDAIDDLGQAARDQIPPEQAAQFVGHMERLTQEAEASRQKMLGLGTATTNAKDTTRDTARQVETIARGALDAAEAFGVINSNAARTLDAAINIAAAIGRIATGDVIGGAAGVIGAVTNIVSAMMQGDRERRELLAKNNQALAKLSRDIGGLKLNVTEEDIINARGALGSVLPQLRGGRGAANENDVRAALESRGLTMGDLQRIADALGIQIRTSSGALNVEAVQSLFQALGTTRVGRLPSDFSSQLDFFRQGQDMDGADGAGGLNGLLDFLRNVGGVTALNGLSADDPAALRAALRNLFTRLNNGEGVQGLGRLTGSQFMDVILDIIRTLDQPAGEGSGSTVETGGATGGLGVVTGGGITAPVSTVQEVIKSMDTNLGTILTTHTTIHERIAVATEGSWEELQQINAKMDTLIAVSGGTDRTDAALEAERFALAVQQGRGVTF